MKNKTKHTIKNLLPYRIQDFSCRIIAGSLVTCMYVVYIVKTLTWHFLQNNAVSCASKGQPLAHTGTSLSNKSFKDDFGYKIV